MNDLRKARIVIVDDEVSYSCLMCNVLNRLGYNHVQSYTNARQMLAEIATTMPDVIILDLHMPDLDGFGTLEMLRPMVVDDAIPTLVLTGNASIENKRKALTLGATDFLQKPFDPSELLMRLRNLLRARFLRQEVEAQNQLLEEKVAARTTELEHAVAELKQTHEHLLQNARLNAFAEMAGGVVHDFNNALMSVIGYSEILLSNPELLDQRETLLEYLRTINTTGNDAAEIVSRLRDFYRPRSEAESLTAEDINKLVEEAVRMSQPKWKAQASNEGRDILVDLDLAKLPLSRCNAAEIREVIVNLLFNAADAMPNGGMINLRSARVDNEIVLEISDTGIGMPEEVRCRCLEPFFTTKGDRGTGLGLSAAFGIVKRHEGRIEIESEVGRGTTLRILLPIRTARNPAEIVDARSAAPHLRILLVDDDRNGRDIVLNHLESDHHAVSVAGSGNEALNVFEAGAFDLIVTDQAMPGLTGLQLARVARRIDPGIGIIILTACGTPPGEVTTAVNAILEKPITRLQLRAEIARITAGTRERSEPLEARRLVNPPLPMLSLVVA
jgi:signal transduction histidine kinase